MDVGVHLPQVAATGPTPDMARVIDVVDAARDLGLAALTANDHFSFRRPWLDGLTLLAAVAQRAGPLDLATTVALPSLRGPVQLAAALSTLTRLTPGRVVAGVGAGSSDVDHALTGVPVAERWPRFDESTRVLRALLTGDDALPMAWVERLADASLLRPATPVPVWVASWGSAAGLRRVAALGDGWLASAYNTTPEAFATGRASVARELVRLGRDPDAFPAAVATMWTWVDDDPARADRVLVEQVAPLVNRDPAELRDRVCIGTPQHCAALLSAYARAGCSRVHLWPVGDETAQLQRIVTDVLPLVGP